MATLRLLASCVLLTVASASCGPSTPRQAFEQAVAPMLERNCLATQCHGVLPDAEARGETINWAFFNIRVLADGRIVDMEQAYATAKRFINTTERTEFSTLVRKPLAVEQGGQPHLGGSVFRTREDPSYRTLVDWIGSESGGGEGRPLSALTANQQLFATTVLPRLATQQCFNQGCHGPFAPFTGFEPPMLLDGALAFSTAATVKNYDAARMHLFLGGDPILSRIIRKNEPLDNGGIAHRGGNDIFFNRAAPGDPRTDPTVAAIAAWADAERQALLGPVMPEVSAVVFVRGPVAAEPPFVHDAFVPGTDLFVLEPPAPGGALRNLTSSAHAAPADVRDPAVDHDGTRVAFAMRTSLADAFNIYTIGIDGTGLRALTTDAAALLGGGTAANVQPTWGPDGYIYFASTRAGHVADNLGNLDTEIWRVHPDTLDLLRISYDPAPEVMPTFIGTGKSYGTMAFTILRQIGDRYKATVFRTPIDHNGAYHADPNLHPHHGATIPEDILYGMRTLPDGRFVATLFDRTNLWRGGRLAVFERQFGPDLPPGMESISSVPGFRHAFSRLDDTVSPAGVSAGGFYRDPAPLADGRIVVARAQGPLDLDSPSAAPDLGLFVATLIEDRATNAPALGSLEVLLDEPGVNEYDPEPVVRRPPEDDPTHEFAWDPAALTGRVELRYLTTLETILSNLLPVGPKVVRTDIANARILVPVLMTPDDLAARGAVSLGRHVPTVIVAEAPPAGDSFNLDVPPNTPFRLQLLNADRMAVGAQLNLWPFIAPGERFGLSVGADLYPIMCGNCHGGLSGDPGEGVGGPVPDVITAASVTLATHENRNPRRPLAAVPVPVGGQIIAVDFRSDVLPILGRSCATAGCHAGAAPAGGLDLVPLPTASFDTTYEALLRVGPGSVGGRAYVNEGGSSAYTSYLTEIVYGRELGAPRSLSGLCPGGVPPLADDEKLTLVRWMDMGAVYH